MSNTLEMIAVMTAHTEGKAIEYQPVNTLSGAWFNITELDWNWQDRNYRIKPEPLELFAVLRNDRTLAIAPASEENADAMCKTWNSNRSLSEYQPYTVIKMREVL